MVKTKITIQVEIASKLDKVWKMYTSPKDIMKWNNASPDWHTPKAENDLRAGGKFNYRMEAKDGSFGFDFWGIYDQVKQKDLIEYTLGDKRKSSITFKQNKDKTQVTIIFEAESQNPIDMQKAGWQSILDNFKKYVENN